MTTQRWRFLSALTGLILVAGWVLPLGATAAPGDRSPATTPATTAPPPLAPPTVPPTTAPPTTTTEPPVTTTAPAPAAPADPSLTASGEPAPIEDVPPPVEPPPGEIDQTPDAVPNQFIVTLDDAAWFSPAPVEATAAEVAAEHQGQVLETYDRALKGFATRMTEAEALELSRRPGVAAVEEDAVVVDDAVQSSAPWQVDRIDQRSLPLNSTYNYGNDGTGVRAYVIDSGIRFSHAEFENRASLGKDFVNDGRNGNDCRGHGTHVAGIVGGRTYGAAKKVRLVAVRVTGCSGTPSATASRLISAVDWVTANGVKPAVVNMSVSVSTTSSLNTAVQNSINRGFTYFVSGGNGGTSACGRSPASLPAAVAAGYTTKSDARSSNSNTGSCLDLFAPGDNVKSAWHSGNTATQNVSGTSMAAPLIAGVAARYLQANPGASPASVTNAILTNATTGKVTNAGSGSPNRLLFSGFLEGSTPPPPPPPSSTTPTTSPGTTAPTAAPTGITAKPADEGQAHVSFTPIPDSANGGSPVTSYLARCTASGQAAREESDTTAPFGPIVVEGLTNGVQYSCNVRAINARGAGPTSSGDSVRVGAPTAPPRVTNVKGSAPGQVDVAWAAASAPPDAPVTGHTIKCVASSTTKTVEVGNVLASTVTGLNAGTTYECKVAAKNTHGTGAFKLPVAGTTPG